MATATSHFAVENATLPLNDVVGLAQARVEVNLQDWAVMVRQTYSAMLAVLLGLGVVLHASPVDKAIADAESRRKGAESSLREIMAKSEVDDDVRKAYASAASNQNAWLDLVTKAVEQGAPTPPDVTEPSQAAAAALMEWVAVGGRALGLPPLSAKLADGLKKSVTLDLIDIGNSTYRSYAGATDAEKRGQAIASLRARLRWKNAEEVSE